MKNIRHISAFVLFSVLAFGISAGTTFAVVGEGTATIDGVANATVEQGTSQVFTVVLTVGASGITANAENPTFTVPAGFTTPTSTPVATVGDVLVDGDWFVAGGATCVIDSPSVGLTTAVGQVITVDVTTACTVGPGGKITLTYKGKSDTSGVVPFDIGTNDVISYLAVQSISLAPNSATLPTITVTAAATSGPVWEEEGTPNGVLDAGEHFFQTIQSAIDAGTTVSGDTIFVSAGNYDEQVVIDGKDLTLKGAGDTTIIRPSAPAKLVEPYTYPAGTFWPGTVIGSVVLVKNSASVTLKDFKVDGVNVTTVPAGASRVAGVLYGESSGTIDNVTVTTMVVDGYVTRSYGIDLSAVGTARTVEVKNSHIMNWSRNGIQAQGASLTANIHDNTLVGPGDVHVAGAVPNGILFIHGVGGNATGNTISAIHHSVTTSRSAGILFYDPVIAGIVVENNNISDVDDGVNVSANANDVIIRNNNLHNNLESGIHLEDGAIRTTITGNTITGNTIAGIRFAGAADPSGGGPDTPPGANNVAHSNNISGNGFGAVNWDSGLGQIFDASNNWWGNASGPTHASNTGGTGDAISDAVTFTPYYTDSLLNHLKGITTTSIESNQASTTISIATTQSGLDSNGGTVTAEIPEGTVLTGNSSWDGSISAPTPPATTVTVVVPGFNTTVASAFTVGSSISDIMFDKAVRLVFTGQAGTHVGWYNPQVPSLKLLRTAR